jgi:exodeoxyribonuclease VIII
MIDQYFLRTEISNSDLTLIDKHPILFERKHELKEEPTPAMIFGSAYHAFILEPDKFDSLYCFYEGRKAGKLWDEFSQQNANKTILSMDMLVQLKAMRDVLKSSKLISTMLHGSINEQVYCGEFEGVKVRGKLDMSNNGYVFDLKTTANINEFAKSIVNFSYNRQAAFYSDLISQCGHDVKKFVFIVQEKEAPYICGAFVLEDRALELGRSEYKRILNKWKEWQTKEKTGEELFMGLQVIDLPWYAYGKNT